MSEKYPGGLITKTPVTPAGPYQTGAASGVWTRDQQMRYQKQGIWPTAGLSPNYIEDVFSTYLYTGNGSTQTITNGIDLSTKGGMVWTKSRSVAKNNGMWDTVRGAGTGSGSPNNKTISSNGLNLSAFYSTDYLSAFNTDGFNVTYGDATYSVANQSGTTYVGWAFRKQPKFFDIQTWTGNGTAGKTITHALGSVPACIMVLCTTANYSWFVYHKDANAGGATTSLNLASTTAAANEGNAGIQNLTSTTFALGGAGATSTRLNDSGQTYIAYIFASNAGGFGLTGTDNVITCGSFTGNGATPQTVNLGYEAQWVNVKNVSNAENWYCFDNMRGISQTSDAYLIPNSSTAEAIDNPPYITATATGFIANNWSSPDTYIYIAIRRGPMKTPTSGTKVFSPVLRTTSEPNFITNFVVDASIYNYRPGGTGIPVWTSRLLGGNGEVTSSAGTEVGLFGNEGYAFNTGVGTGNSANSDVLTWNFQRAPGFFDVVCYTGTDVNQTLNHNLTVAPTLMIIKRRNTTGDWWVVDVTGSQQLNLNQTYAASGLTTALIPSAPTATTFSVGTYSQVNGLSDTFVAYLFATCAGVSKVGTYTGTGATQTISCGFTGGARFVLIKRTNSTGDWYVWDTARGMVSGTDPSLLLNTTAAEVNANSIYTATGGFQIVSTAAGINASGGTYIFLAIA